MFLEPRRMAEKALTADPGGSPREASLVALR